ncbi:hypothetical protein WME99_11275 [Sorangium sp. So ce136]|uniref:hypothetical protein n=1 Tax=Sorangium sp. So ce136 TaxID=3133284 RepID=UPI003F0AD0B6
MTPQAAAKLMNAGGGLATSGVKTPMCRAFRKAVTEYCRKPKGKRGKFNNKFFKHLRKIDPKLAKQMHREVPFLMRWAGTAGQLVGSAAGLAKGPPPAGPIAKVMEQAFSSTRGWDAARDAAYAAYKGVGNRRFYPRFPDAMLNGQVVEVKGPADFFRKPSQAADYQTISSPKQPIVLSCAACNANCTNGPGGGCPGD